MERLEIEEKVREEGVGDIECAFDSLIDLLCRIPICIDSECLLKVGDLIVLCVCSSFFLNLLLVTCSDMDVDLKL